SDRINAISPCLFSMDHHTARKKRFGRARPVGSRSDASRFAGRWIKGKCIMNLFHKYQSRAFQFALFLLARLEELKSLSQRDISDLAEKLRLDYADQVLQPLCQADILKRQGDQWIASDGFKPFSLPPGCVEMDYLQYILGLPEAGMFL